MPNSAPAPEPDGIYAVRQPFAEDSSLSDDELDAIQAAEEAALRDGDHDFTIDSKVKEWADAWHERYIGRLAEERGYRKPSNDNWVNQTAGPAKKLLQATPFVLRDPKSLPPRAWLYGGHYARKYVTATFGAGGGGKSAHSITETMAMVTGKPLLGEVVRAPLRVWSINLEDDVDEIERRFAGACLHFGIGQSDIGDRLFTDSGREQEFVVARTQGRDVKIVEPVVAAIIREIQERKIDLLIVDPFVSTHSVPENDNGAIQSVAAQWVRVAHECDCGVELVHHVRKGNGLEATADDGRGAGALKDKARSVRVVNAMTKDEGQKAGIPDGDVSRYFRIDLSKFNMTAGAHSQWRRFASVKLGNKPSWFEPGDEIGVVEAWRWPSAEELTEDVSDDELKAILGRLGGGDARESDQATNWAGYVVAEILKIDLDDRAGKTRVKMFLRAWLKSGVLKAEDGFDSSRRTRRFIRVGGAPPPWVSGGAEVEQGVADSIPDTCSTTPHPCKGVGVEQGRTAETQGVVVGGANTAHVRDLDHDDDAPLTDDQIPGFLKKSAQGADRAALEYQA